MNSKTLLPIFLSFYFSINIFSLDEQSDIATETIEQYQLGDKIINIVEYKKGKSDIVFFNMHDDENTGVEAGRQVIDEFGGRLIEIKSEGDRLLCFDIKGKRYIFDPNKIFTDKGIEATLKKYGDYNKLAHEEVTKLANVLIEKVLKDEPKMIVTLHNNDNGDFNIRNYRDRALFGRQALDYYYNDEIDRDDFYYVNSEVEFYYFTSRGYSAVLQDNDYMTSEGDDGSFSVYAALHYLPYINVEVQDGHFDVQYEMIIKVLEYLEKVI
ncbi:MAG: hypothetical protein ABIA04_07540 [Pseudomonadota bacterium]